MPMFNIRCDVTLRGCFMLVKADSEAEALAMGEAFEFDDIEYATGELTDFKITGKPIKDE